MIRGVKWFILTLVGMLSTFFIVYALYCKAYDLDPLDLYAFYRTIVNNNILPVLYIPEIGYISEWVVSAEQQGTILESLSYLVNFFSSIANVVPMILNFLISVQNAIFALIRTVLIVVYQVFAQVR